MALLRYERKIIPAIICLTIFLFTDISVLKASVPGNETPGPMADSIMKQQRDSILFELNLNYLNAVEEHQSPFEVIPIIGQILSIDPQQAIRWFNLGLQYIRIHEYHEAIESLSRGLELFPSEDHSSLSHVYISMSFCYNKIGKYQKDKEGLELASAIFPDHIGLIGRQVICAHSMLRFHKAEEFREKLIFQLRKEGNNEAEIAFSLGRIYLNTDYLVAETYFRTAYQYYPEEAEKQGALAWVLIQNSLRYNEGMILMQKAIKSDPLNPAFIHQLGYGYFVNGEYETALGKLYNAKELYEDYSFELDMHIKMVEEAMAKLED